MILKFITADARASQDHCVHAITENRYESAYETLIDEVERVEYGGPLLARDCEGRTGLADGLGEGESYVDADDLRCAVSRAIVPQVPHESHHHPFTEVIDCTSRSGQAPDLQFGGVWWVKAFMRHPALDGGKQIVLYLHDTRAFLCDDRGQTLEKLGPR